MNDKQDKETRAALEVLADLDHGALARELTEAIKGASTACIQEGGKATITVKLVIEARPHSDGNRVTITPTLETKLPKHVRNESLFFVTDDGDLSRNPPKQHLMFAEGAERTSAHAEAASNPHSV